MKILIAGKPRSGQHEVIEKLIDGSIDVPDSLVGYVHDHKFKTKYFTVDCGIWADEFDNSQEWSEEFRSEEAKEVRDAIVLFIYTLGSSNPETSGLDEFVTSLGRPGNCLAVAKDGVQINESAKEKLLESGFDIVTLDELPSIVHSALYDAVAEGSESGGSGDELDDNARVPEAPRELDEIMDELKSALHSKTMTNEEKRALAERLADELVL